METVLAAVLSAIIAALVTWRGVERQVRIRNVTEERAKWRERVRALAMDLSAGAQDDDVGRRRARMGLRLSLNPYDRLDREIVALLERLGTSASADELELRRLAPRLQLLLKHDWERAKREATWFAPAVDLWRRLRGRPLLPARPDYEAFRRWRTRNPLDQDDALPPS